METSDEKNQQIIENYKTICLCRNIKKGTIIKAIQSGCSTIERVNSKLGSGSGDCQGERCQDKIREIVASLKNKSEKEAF